MHSCSSPSGWKTSLTRLMAPNHRFINQGIRPCKCSPPSDLCTLPVPQRQERVGEEASKGQAGQHVHTRRAHFYPPCTRLVCAGLKIVRMCSVRMSAPPFYSAENSLGREGGLRQASQPLLSPQLHLVNLHNHCQSPTPVYSLILQKNMFTEEDCLPPAGPSRPASFFPALISFLLKRRGCKILQELLVFSDQKRKVTACYFVYPFLLDV